MAKKGQRNPACCGKWSGPNPGIRPVLSGSTPVLAEKLLEQGKRRATATTRRTSELLTLLRRRLEIRVGRPLDGDVGDLPLAAAQDRHQLGIEAVDVLAEFQLAVLVDKCGLIHQVDRDLGLEVELLFLAAQHPL